MNFNLGNIGHLGLVNYSKRNIKSGNNYDRYFPLGSQSNSKIMASDDVYATRKAMKKIVLNTLDETREIASFLKGKTLEETTRNIFKFMFDHVKYTKDRSGIENLRSPLATWKEKKGDCDDYSIFISSVLTNLGIPHAMRMAKYGGKDYFQHIYVIVPNGKSYITVDPVVDEWNYEEPYSEKNDLMISNNLSGLGAQPGFAGPGLGGWLKDAWNGIKRFNPLSATIRAGLASAFKDNSFNISEKLGYVYLTQEQAEGLGIDIVQLKKFREKFDKVEKIWVNALAGKESMLKSEILIGWQHGCSKHNRPYIDRGHVGNNEYIVGNKTSTSRYETFRLQDIVGKLSYFKVRETGEMFRTGTYGIGKGTKYKVPSVEVWNYINPKNEFIWLTSKQADQWEYKGAMHPWGTPGAYGDGKWLGNDGVRQHQMNQNLINVVQDREQGNTGGSPPINLPGRGGTTTINIDPRRPSSGPTTIRVDPSRGTRPDERTATNKTTGQTVAWNDNSLKSFFISQKEPADRGRFEGDIVEQLFYNKEYLEREKKTDFWFYAYLRSIGFDKVKMANDVLRLTPHLLFDDNKLKRWFPEQKPWADKNHGGDLASQLYANKAYLEGKKQQWHWVYLYLKSRNFDKSKLAFDVSRLAQHLVKPKTQTATTKKVVIPVAPPARSATDIKRSNVTTSTPTPSRSAVVNTTPSSASNVKRSTVTTQQTSTSSIAKQYEGKQPAPPPAPPQTVSRSTVYSRTLPTPISRTLPTRLRSGRSGSMRGLGAVAEITAGSVIATIVTILSTLDLGSLFKKNPEGGGGLKPGTQLPGGGIVLPDGNVQMPDGTIINPETGEPIILPGGGDQPGNQPGGSPDPGGQIVIPNSNNNMENNNLLWLGAAGVGAYLLLGGKKKSSSSQLSGTRKRTGRKKTTRKKSTRRKAKVVRA